MDTSLPDSRIRNHCDRMPFRTPSDPSVATHQDSKVCSSNQQSEGDNAASKLQKDLDTQLPAIDIERSSRKPRLSRPRPKLKNMDLRTVNAKSMSGFSWADELHFSQAQFDKVLKSGIDRNRVTLMLDLDHTALFGNDGNDLGIAMQWLGKDVSTVQELYKKLINPSLRNMYLAYKAQGKDVDVVVYTRRPAIHHYESENGNIAMQYDPEWHADGQIYFPPCVASSSDIMATYRGRTISKDIREDASSQLDRLLAVIPRFLAFLVTFLKPSSPILLSIPSGLSIPSPFPIRGLQCDDNASLLTPHDASTTQARNAIVHELGLETIPTVVVAAQPKNVEATARHLQLPVDTALLFDDNTNLRDDPRVVIVPKMTTMPRDRREDLLRFLNREAPPHALDSDLVEFFEEAPPEDRAISRDSEGSIHWRIPLSSGQESWLTPEPGSYHFKGERDPGFLYFSDVSSTDQLQESWPTPEPGSVHSKGESDPGILIYSEVSSA